MAQSYIEAAPVEVRFTEGVGHAFLLLRSLDGTQIVSGDLIQVVRDTEIQSRMVFHFKDGSLLDETVVFTQDDIFVMRSYHLLQRGPAFTEDTELVLERASGRMPTDYHAWVLTEEAPPAFVRFQGTLDPTGPV